MCDFLSFTITNHDGLKIWYGGDLTSHNAIEREYGVVGYEVEWLGNRADKLHIRLTNDVSQHYGNQILDWVVNNFPTRTHLLQYMLQNKKLHNIDLNNRYGNLPLSVTCSGYLDIRNTGVPVLSYSEIGRWCSCQSIYSLTEIHDVTVKEWLDIRNTSVQSLHNVSVGKWVDASDSRLTTLVNCDMGKINITNTPLSHMIGRSGWVDAGDLVKIGAIHLYEERELNRVQFLR